MTYAVFDLTEHTQLSIRGPTGTHPDSSLVFGVFMDAACMEKEPDGGIFDGPGYSYDDMDWSRAVKAARWILEKDKELNGGSE